MTDLETALDEAIVMRDGSEPDSTRWRQWDSEVQLINALIARSR